MSKHKFYITTPMPWTNPNGSTVEITLHHAPDVVPAVTIDRSTTIGANVSLVLAVDGEMLICPRVTIGANTSLRAKNVYANVTIGANCFISAKDICRFTTIGENTIIEPLSVEKAEVPKIPSAVIGANVTLKTDWIGASCLIGDKSTITANQLPHKTSIGNGVTATFEIAAGDVRLVVGDNVHITSLTLPNASMDVEIGSNAHLGTVSGTGWKVCVPQQATVPDGTILTQSTKFQVENGLTLLTSKEGIPFLAARNLSPEMQTLLNLVGPLLKAHAEELAKQENDLRTLNGRISKEETSLRKLTPLITFMETLLKTIQPETNSSPQVGKNRKGGKAR